MRDRKAAAASPGADPEAFPDCSDRAVGLSPPAPRPPARPRKNRLSRRLAAIMAADVVDYTRLMAEDEDATHLEFRAIWRELIAPSIAGHAGRIVKSTGDGFLAEFQSAIGAVSSALSFQSAIRARADAGPACRRVLFRVGIHIGDVIVEPHDIFGHSVNLAFRLEGLAEPGGVLISEVVHASIHASLIAPIEAAGCHLLKNLATPVRAFRVPVG